ncbi:MAG: ATPase [Candidatus Omnitrophica bacterium]|jgi:hypothetical protein|nr:ATPase [Candidatus Omnitrophota bacterium]
MEKSYVSLDTKICIFCGKQFEIGIILDKRLKNTLEKNTITGIDLCPECTKEDYILLIEIDEDKSSIESDESVKPENAYKTGRAIYVKMKHFQKIFGTTSKNKFSFINERGYNKFQNNL